MKKKTEERRKKNALNMGPNKNVEVFSFKQMKNGTNMIMMSVYEHNNNIIVYWPSEQFIDWDCINICLKFDYFNHGLGQEIKWPTTKELTDLLLLCCVTAHTHSLFQLFRFINSTQHSKAQYATAKGRKNKNAKMMARWF